MGLAQFERKTVFENRGISVVFNKKKKLNSTKFQMSKKLMTKIKFFKNQYMNGSYGKFKLMIAVNDLSFFESLS